MPIKGLTDRHKPAFPELGQLRKGAQKPERGPGKDLDHFRFTSEQTEVGRAFHDAYGDQPKMLTVYLPYKKPEENFEAWKEAYKASQLLHRCDGENMVLWYGEDGKYHTEPKKCTGECKATGRLKVILPELIKAGHIGFVTVLTTSLHDIMSLQSSLEAAAEVSPAGLSGVPMLLWRQPEKISTPVAPGSKERRRKSMSLLKLAPATRWVQAQLAAAESRAFAMLEGPKANGYQEPEEPVDEESGEIGDTIESTATEIPTEPPAKSFPDPEKPEPPALAFEESELPPKPPAANGERAALEAELRQLSDAQGRTWSKVVEHFCSKWNHEWADATVAELKGAIQTLQASGKKAS